jgi:hypothetical protein
MDANRSDARVDVLIPKYARTSSRWYFLPADTIHNCGDVIIKFPAATTPSFFANPGVTQLRTEGGVRALDEDGNIIGEATTGLTSTTVVLHSEAAWPQWHYHYEDSTTTYPWWEDVAGGATLSWKQAFDRAAYADYALRLDLTGRQPGNTPPSSIHNIRVRVHVSHRLVVVASWPGIADYDIQQDHEGGSFDTYVFQISAANSAFFVRFRDERGASVQLMLSILLSALLGAGLGFLAQAYLPKHES